MTDQDFGDGTDRPALTAPSTGEAARHERRQARLATDEEFSAFYRADISRLAGFLMWLGAGAATAADIAQETMTKAYRRWPDLENPAAWVRTVASRALVRRISDVREHPVGSLPEPSPLLPHPDSTAQWEEHQETLRVLRRLPPRQRQVLAWTLDGYTPAEIARELRMTPEAVRANLMKARRAAARHLKQREEGQ
ncbi:SigE family RNA polymerase sigma factor [Streptomyces sodiiphilus]|uniref:SigE family RNA polymerase sigma factor n=1 Tax=Streptomyces sodiiphilus TaxID=226217 RepID=A0ABP5A5E5_9ACTN